MNEALVRWVVDNSPAEGAIYAAHLALAMHADGRRNVREAQNVLAHDARIHVETFRRSVRALADAGLVEIVEQPAGRAPATLRLLTLSQTGSTDAILTLSGTGSTGPEPPGSPQVALEGLDQDNADAARRRAPKPKREPREFELEARSITERLWTARAVPPAQPFVAVVKIVEALLAVGWPGDEVEAAATAVPAISSRWCEAWLNEQRKRATAPRGKIDDDRQAPSGRIEL